jgi:hypothetical protein
MECFSSARLRLSVVAGKIAHLWISCASIRVKRRLSLVVDVRALQVFAVICISFLLWNCGGGGTSSPPPPPPVTITAVTVASSATVVRVGQTGVFTATVRGTGAYSSAVTWSVNGVIGGNTQTGTINNGTYSAPAAPPSTNPINVIATSVADPSKFGTATATVYILTIAPANPTLSYGQTLQFAATVTGFNNPVVQWSARAGQIDATGLYTAPATGTQPTQDAVTASVMGTAALGTASVNLQPLAPRIVSISPNQGIVGQTVTLNCQNLLGATKVFFSLPNGVPVSAVFTAVSPTQIDAIVPLGTANGPVFAQYIPPNGGVATTNSINFTRLPNLHIRAQSTELSSGETTQFYSRLLGGSTTNAVGWTADQGTISTSGLYQAPTVSGEQFATITGCLPVTNACDSVMVRVLPFRVTPSTPIVSLGSTLQLDAIQGGTQLSPPWSLPAADGSITQGGLFTAPNTTSQAGPVPVNASFGGNTESTSVAVTGGFPGLVNRVWDYVNFNNPANLGMSVESVAVSGSRAYCVDLGAPFAPNLSYAAIDVYDISNPQRPVWLDAVDATSNLPLHIFTYGNYLITVDSGFLVPVPSRISIYNIQGQTPVVQSVVGVPDLAFSQVNNGVVYGLGEGVVNTTLPTFPVYTFDVRSGSVIQNTYNMTPPPGIQPQEFFGITGSGNIVYVSMLNQVSIVPRLTIAAYDISTTPPTLVGSVLSDRGFNRLQVVNQLLFADGEVYDISKPNPLLVASFPLISVQSVLGNQVLALGDAANYVVLDVSNAANPVITENIASLASEDLLSKFPNAVWAGKSFLSADGLGGFSVYDASSPGGPSSEVGNPVLLNIFDQTLQLPALYAAGTATSGSGGIMIFDASGAAPNLLGQLLYPNQDGLAIQVTGNTAFLGLTDTLKVLDVSNTTSPNEVASLSIPTNALALSGTKLFDGTGDSRLVVLDVSNPSAPKQMASTPIPGPPVTMRVVGNLLFVADGPQGLLIFDISAPASPVLLSQFSLSVPVWDVVPSGTVALLAADLQGLVVVDVSSPTNVKQLSQTALPPFNPFPPRGSASSSTQAVSVAIHGGLGYVGTAANGNSEAPAAVAAFDFGQPTSPRLVAFHIHGGVAISVITPSGNEMFLADDGTEVQFDNSFPRNSIELYDPPTTLAQPFASLGVRRPSRAYVHPKLNRNWKRSQRKHQHSPAV